MSSLNFLAGKEFHPSTKQNQKKVWEAEQKEKERAREASRRQAVLKEERKAAFELAKGDGARRLSRKEQQQLRDLHSVSFMYRAPPGFQSDKDKQRQEHEQQQQEQEQEPALDDAERRRRDKAMTRKEKFPELRNAPLAGAYAQKLDLRVNMLGKIHRNVKCTRCQVWGHKSGERECPMRGHNPNDEQRQRREDPMAAFLPPKDHDDGGARDRIVLNETPRKNGSPIRGGFESDDPNQQLLSSDNEADGVVEDDDKELRYVRGLSEQERVALMKKLKKQEKDMRKKKKDRKRRRKEKKERKNAHARTQTTDAITANSSRRH